MASAIADEDSFPQKLWSMVEDRKYEEIIWWNKGGDGFLICEERKFLASGILEVYKFKHNKFCSFVRQLNNYGFQKRKNGKITKAYHHGGGYFIRNQPELSKITKHKKKGATDSGVSSEAESLPLTDQVLEQQSTQPQLAVAIIRNRGPVEGNDPFSLRFIENNRICYSVQYLLVDFEGNTVKAVRKHNENDTWLGETPAGDKAGPVTVKIKTPDGNEVGITQYTYYSNEIEDAMERVVSSTSLQWSYFSEFKMQQCTNQGSGENSTANPSCLGFPKQEGKQQSVLVLRCLVYTAARIGAEKFIRMIFSTSAGRTVFEVYKNESLLPEDIADANGHDEIAAYLRTQTERFFKENDTSQTQSNDINWLELLRAVEESEVQSGPSETTNLLKELDEDGISEAAYFGDTETYSDPYKERTEEHPDSEVSIPEKMSFEGIETFFCISGWKNSDLEDVPEGNRCKGISPSFGGNDEQQHGRVSAGASNQSSSSEDEYGYNGRVHRNGKRRKHIKDHQKFVIHPHRLWATRSELRAGYISASDSTRIPIDNSKSEGEIRACLMQKLPKLKGKSFKLFVKHTRHGNIFCPCLKYSNNPCQDPAHAVNPVADWNGKNITKMTRRRKVCYIYCQEMIMDKRNERVLTNNQQRSDNNVTTTSTKCYSATLPVRGDLLIKRKKKADPEDVPEGNRCKVPSMPPYTAMEQDDPPASYDWFGRGRDPHNQQFQAQDQVQLQRHRKLQGNTRMLFGIYEHTMDMIEELKKHEEHGKSVFYSGLLNHPPAYQTKSLWEAKKPKDDVEAICKVEFVKLPAQMTFAPPEEKQRAKEKMLHRTNMWLAAQEERGIPRGRVNEYACNVVDILNGESMSLPQGKKGLGYV